MNQKKYCLKTYLKKENFQKSENFSVLHNEFRSLLIPHVLLVHKKNKSIQFRWFDYIFFILCAM